jgi:hypothetical protein
MRVTSRPLAPGEIDFELVILVASVGGFGLAIFWFALHLPWPICLFHALTGFPCLTCGATRAAIACVHLQFFTALRWNPLAVIIYGTIALFDAYAVGVLLIRSRRVRAYFSAGEKRALRATVIALLLVNWMYLLSHSSMFNS